MGGLAMKQSAEFPVLLQLFFTKRLMAQRRVSPHTIASYRDTFRLLLQFAEKELEKRPSEITFEDLSPTFIGAFLDGLEHHRRNDVRSRNVRMTANRSFFRYAALDVPEHAGSIQRVLAIPRKRQERRLVGFLTRPEIDALLSAPNRKSWLGRRDYALLIMAIQTGLRVSELTALCRQDVVLTDQLTFVALVKDGRSAARHWRKQPSPSSQNGFGNGTAEHPAVLPECSRRSPQFRCRPVHGLQILRRGRAEVSGPETQARLRHTCFVTPPPWNCSRQV